MSNLPVPGQAGQAGQSGPWSGAPKFEKGFQPVKNNPEMLLQPQTSALGQMENADDDTEMQKAIQQSLEDGEAAAAMTIPQPPPKTRGPDIDDFIKDMTDRTSTERKIVDDPEGDTWVYIDAPPQQPEQDDVDYSNYKQRCRIPHVVRKSAMESLKSEVINDMFGPTAQYRVLRRRELVNKLPSKIKYVLDLTPPTEGDEAVWCMSLLCCPEGIRLWHFAADIWKVSSSMVGGEEEFTSLSSRMASRNASSPQPKSSNSPNRITKKTPLSPGSSSQPKIDTAYQLSRVPEYTPLRHHTAIEALLSVASDQDPVLNSAPKVWTLFGLTQFYGIAEGPLTDYIVRWLCAPPNSKILEVMPEVCLIIADHFHVHDLARDAFAILVGENALDRLVHVRKPYAVDKIWSTYARRKLELPETLEELTTRIEYATHRFTDRILTESAGLFGGDMAWINSLPEVQKLGEWTQPELQPQLEGLRVLLARYVCGTLNNTLRANYVTISRPSLPPTTGRELFLNPERGPIWNDLYLTERLFSRSFWKILMNSDLFRGNSTTHLSGLWYTRLNGHDQTRDHSPPGVDWPCDDRIEKADLVQSIARCRQEAYKSVHPPENPEKFSREPLMAIAKWQSNGEASYNDAGPNFNIQAIPFRLRTAGSGTQENTVPENSNFDHSITTGYEAASTASRHVSFTSNTPSLALSSQQESPAETRSGHEIFTMQELEQPPKQAVGDYANKPLPPPILKDFRYYEFFNLFNFFRDAEKYVVEVATRMLASTDAGMRADPYPAVEIVDTLVGLGDEEFKYLPLWAGGFDDGSGGVFNDDVPISDSGFATAGPGIHTESSRGSTSSEYDLLSTGSSSGANTSTATLAGRTNELQESRVYAASSVNDSSSESDFADISATGSIRDDISLGDFDEVPQRTGANTTGMTTPAATDDVDEMMRDSEEDYSDIFESGSDEEDQETLEEDEGEDSDDTMTLIDKEDYQDME